MYSEKVMDHFQNPRNVGEIEDASGVGTVGNAKCGDIMRIYLDIDENQVIRDAKFKTFGCGAAVATSSMATELVKGKKIQEALESLKSFGPTFYVEKESVINNEAPVVEKPKAKPEPIEEEIEVVDVLDAQTFKNLVELRNALVANGIDVPTSITNVKAAESFAKKNGYNYTIEKNA